MLPDQGRVKESPLIPKWFKECNEGKIPDIKHFEGERSSKTQAIVYSDQVKAQTQAFIPVIWSHERHRSVIFWEMVPDSSESVLMALALARSFVVIGTAWLFRETAK